ncbi:TonB-dependent receptor [Robiginitomaculum antarcticum]|uniref:TonB-dependent receptor n=1 Tax=Robiginitomaculum antarcticum TaxID=437507 RepID=UPI000380F43F|nr:TonB-dependent receptor [Robiginitomaculum antarcticum]
MKNAFSSLGFCALLSTSALALSLSLATPASAQVTTSSIRGQVFGQDGAPVSGATAVIVHTPSGTTSTAVSNTSGVFSARGLRVGGPYSVTLSGNGFDTVTRSNIYTSLDNTYPLNIAVGGGGDEIIATGTLSQQSYLDTGLSTNFNAAELAEVPSIDRDITDVAQLDPFATVNVQSGGPKELIIGGANNRYNSLTIDGVALNDRFGLNANGYPTQRSPIPYDGIESLSIETAPYDIEFNGFTGGTINAVTKSGENDIHGSAGYYYSDDGMAGDKVRDRDIDQSFEEKSYSFTLGGPIIKDRLFAFAAYEKYEEAAALRDGPIGSGALNERNVTQADITRIGDVMQNVYGFDIGAFGIEPVEEEKYLISVDANITNQHRAKFTYLHNEGSTIVQTNGNSFLTDRRVDVLGTSSTFYNRSETVDSYIGHLYSDWTPNLSTEVKIAFTEQSTGQDSLGGNEFPLFTVRTGTGANVTLGPDTFRHGNELDQEFFQIKAKAEYVAGDHTFKLGLEREDVDVDNLFALNAEGQYFFSSIDNLENAVAETLIYENAITNNENDRRAIWGYNLTSLYFQDTWDATDTLTMQLGVRYDRYGSEGTIRRNANFQQRYGYLNTIDLEGVDVIMPRFSFNWDATDNVRVRGGIGKFSGGSPSVWLSNSYSNDGVTNDDVFRGGGGINVPTTPDATTGNYIPADVLAQLANTTPDGSVAALAPNFEIPTTFKANLGVAYDVDIPYLGDAWLLSADVLYNRYDNAPHWFDQSCLEVSASPDGRPVYDCTQNGPEAIVVESVDKGNGLLLAVSADKDWETNYGDFGLFTSYTYSDINDIGQGTSSTATSNYSDTPRFSYQVAQTGTSNFETEHSFKMRLKWEKAFFGDYKSRVSLFGTRRTGQPYSYTFNTTGRADVFGIRENRADDAGALLYVPNGITDPLFSPLSFGGNAVDQQAFIDYINGSELAEYRGGIAPRNAFNSRWSSIVDLKLEQELPGAFEDHKTSVFFSIQNLGNLLNSDWGVIERVRYEYEQQTASATIDNGQYVYGDLDTTLNQEILSQSLWRAQFGVKYEF